jgi:hypothetical protein
MIVYDLDLLGADIVPHEADAPLIVDADTMLPNAVSLHGLQTVSGRRGQVVQLRGLMNLSKLPLRGPLDVLRQPLGKSAMEQRFGLTVGERSDHEVS